MILTIAYDGSAYAGWQMQVGVVTVQQRIEEALAKLFLSTPRLHSSSRTDTGVHARGMKAHFDVPKAEFRMLPQKLVLAINAHLPEDIRINGARKAKSGFHARFSAIGKQYRYFVWNHPSADPLLRRQTWHVPRALDLTAMRTAARTLVGHHDFRAFSATPGYERENTVRHLTRCDVLRSGALLTFRIEADGFLYKMCRGIVGTLVQVGFERFRPDEILPMLESQDRSVAGMTAPAQGLVLWRVYYKASNRLQTTALMTM
ncbi:MAG: tRNA pseudouridine(38-40) synthase TruA [Pedosphaera sp.]|nr:tRNA pseudouridine(38-40) synthase TruA [Pedosphaera sp.]